MFRACYGNLLHNKVCKVSLVLVFAFLLQFTLHAKENVGKDILALVNSPHQLSERVYRVFENSSSPLYTGCKLIRSLSRAIKKEHGECIDVPDASMVLYWKLFDRRDPVSRIFLGWTSTYITLKYYLQGKISKEVPFFAPGGLAHCRRLGEDIDPDSHIVIECCVAIIGIMTIHEIGMGLLNGAVFCMIYENGPKAVTPAIKAVKEWGENFLEEDEEDDYLGY